MLILVFRLVEDIGPDQKPSDRFIVARVIDGDTFELQGGDRVRLLSIDTPEKEDPFYDEAKDYLSTATLGQPVRIEYANQRRDKYGRLLGYVYVDSLFVNRAILENGLGYLYLFKDTDLGRPETEQLLNAQRQAIKTGVGLWSIKRQPEEHYIAGQNSFRFHRPGCPSTSRMKPGTFRRFATREEAAYEGLSPCRNCAP